MRRRNKDDALYFRAMIKHNCLFENFARVIREWRFGWRRAEKIAPDFVARVSDHQATDHSAHAVTDQDDALVIWECAPDPIKILAEERCGVRIRITTRITEVPELIILSDRGIMPKGVDHWRPAGSCFLQA